MIFKNNREYWYDIYALSEHRNKDTIEKFLHTFADREKIESRKRDTIIVIPDSEEQRNTLFEVFSTPNIFDPSHRHSSYREKILEMRHQLEYIHTNTLTEGIEAGLSKPERAFSLYIRNYTRSDIRCLILHFTLDNKVIFGISVADTGAQGEINLPLAREIQREMEALLAVKGSYVAFESYAADSETDFISSKQRWEEKLQEPWSEEELESYRNNFSAYNIFYERHNFHYGAYRERQHHLYRRIRGKVVYAVNYADYFTLADREGNIANLIHRNGDIVGGTAVSDLQASDAAVLPYLGSLLEEATGRQNKGFEPTHVLRVSLPSLKNIELITRGHWDRASHMTSYRGVRSHEFIIEDTYALNSLEDMKRLAEEGFFTSGGSFFIYTGNNRGYENWLVKNNQAELYLSMLEDEDLGLEADPVTLLHLIGKSDWQKFLSCLHQFEFDKEDELRFVIEISRKINGELTVSQAEDLLALVEVPDFVLSTMIDNATKEGQFDLFRTLTAKAKETPDLAGIVRAIKRLLEEPPARAEEFIQFYLDLIEKKYGAFYDEEILLAVAACEDQQALLEAILKLMPKEQWKSPLLLSYALSTENERLLEGLTISEEEVLSFKREQIKLAKAINKKEYPKYTIEVVSEGNYFQAEYFASRLEAKDLVSPMLEACTRGMIGIVKLLVEQGKVHPGCWFNYPVKCANMKNYARLKTYLLSKGVNDEEFQ